MRTARTACLCALLALPLLAATDTLEPVKKGLAADVARLAVEDMRFRWTGRSLAVAPFRNDPDGLVATALTEQLEARGLFDVVEKPTWREWWDKIVGNDKDSPIGADKAIEFGKKLEAECVMFGRVEALVVDEGRSYADVKIRIVDVKTGDGIFIGRYRTNLDKSVFSIPYFRVWIYDTSVFVRILIWTVGLLILPFMALLARERLSQSAPIVSIGLMLFMTGVDMVLALLLMGFEADSLLKWGLLVGALAASIFYNLTILAKVADLQMPGRD
ncbi:MAG: hypothetical protein HUU15_18210 [Candidatus Brocadiae bacterium]|nr:hypothetical protein [Candidatus Brocadiia bacterium]